jgi:DNA (cytosine-5)-methyltransferase 1
VYSNLKTALACTKAQTNLRIELMWRKTASRAAIANYVLTKIHNYGKAMKYFT